jgi:hypothetical protein
MLNNKLNKLSLFKNIQLRILKIINSMLMKTQQGQSIKLHQDIQEIQIANQLILLQLV